MKRVNLRLGNGFNKMGDGCIGGATLKGVHKVGLGKI